MLHGLNYSLQSNRKTEEGEDHPDRDAQFRHINASVKKYLAQNFPVISGGKLYPKTKELLITADGGGSNGSRLRLWKFELQKLADQTGLSISVCHFPPGTSTWNKIEHRLFSFITSNWRGEPLRDYETIVKLIANTTTAKGLKVKCRLDRQKYATGRETRFMASGITQLNREF